MNKYNTMLSDGSQAVLVEIARKNGLEYFESPAAGRIIGKDIEVRWHHVGEYRYDMSVKPKKAYYQGLAMHAENAQRTDVFAYILHAVATWKRKCEQRNNYNTRRLQMADNNH